MSNNSEIRDLANGLHYVVRQTKNPSLVKDSVEKLLVLRENALVTNNKRGRDAVITYIDSIISDAQRHGRFRPSDAADYLESQTSSSPESTKCAYRLFAVGLCRINVYFLPEYGHTRQTVRKKLNRPFNI